MRKTILFLVLAFLLLIAPYRRWATQTEKACQNVLIWLNLAEPPTPQPQPSRPEPPKVVDDWVVW